MSDVFPTPSTTPESLLVPILMGGPESLSDSQLVGALLQEPDITRAEGILREAGTLNNLAHSGPLELQALGLQEVELVRTMLLIEWVSRVLAQRRARQLSSLSETVREIRLRGEAWSQECVGLIVINRANTILVDRVLFKGTRNACLVDVQELLREVLRVGADALVVYRWTPSVNAQVLPEDRDLADKIRIAGSALGITLIDLLLVAERSFWSAREVDNWDLR